MAKFNHRGDLDGRLQVVALWLNTKGGLDGRINALVRHKQEYLLGDLTCTLKFGWGRHDSLRRGWEFSEFARELLREKLERDLKLAMKGQLPGVQDFAAHIRDLQTALDDDDHLCHWMAKLRGRNVCEVYRVWSKPHACYWGLTPMKNFKQGTTPERVLDLIDTLDAVPMERSPEWLAKVAEKEDRTIKELETQLAALKRSRAAR